MKTFIKYLLIKLLLVCSFCYSQNQFPSNGDVEINNGNNLIINGGVIRNDTPLSYPNSSSITIDDPLIVNGTIQATSINTFNSVFGNRLVAHSSIDNSSIDVQSNGLMRIMRPENGFWRQGLEFYEEIKPSTEIWAGIGVNGHNDELDRLYITHGAEPWNSILGINILPDGFVGIGTLTPSARLEINSNASNSSGLKLTNLTSSSPSTSGAKAIGVTSTGEVVTIDTEGSEVSGTWLITGNNGTTASTSTYPNNVNNNFLGTTDNQPLVIATDNKERLRISTTGRITFHNNDISPNNVNNLYLGGGNTTTYTDGGNYANTAVGLGSLALISSGYQNLAVGSNALRLNTLGKNNIGLGYNAGTNITTGSDNILIGSGVDAPISATADNQINIGNQVFGYNGQIAIGSYTDIAQAFSNSPGYKLIVKDGIRTEKVRVDLSGVNDWADDVFEDNYDLLPIENLREFIEINRHLPGIPKAEQLVDEGIDVVEMDSNLLRKIEELTLYNIELYDENKRLKEDLMNQQIILEDLIKRIDRIESAQ